ncbi:MAG: PadR family transcriptional regulator [Anaerolineae bacterium]|nr:PadR family transcriptional regulator [Anaerolineae bacterium]
MAVPTPDETILGLLAYQAQHGYQLLDTFQNPTQLGAVWHMSTSQIYAVLKRLEQQGWIQGQSVDVDDAPPRIEYRLSAPGQQRLDQWLNDPQPSASIRRVRVEFLSRLYIAHLLKHPAQALIARQRAACEVEHARLMTQREQSDSSIGGLALELHIAQIEAILQWINRCETRVYPPTHA